MKSVVFQEGKLSTRKMACPNSKSRKNPSSLMKLSKDPCFVWFQGFFADHHHNSQYYIFTAWTASVFGVFLVPIFPHLHWIRRDTPLRIQSEWRKIRTRKTSNKDTFHAVILLAECKQNCQTFQSLVRAHCIYGAESLNVVVSREIQKC